MEQITTARLFMRQFSESDVTEEYVAALNDPEIVRFTEARHTRWTTEKVVQYVKQSNQVGRFELYGMFVKTTDKHIGNIRLSGFSAQHNRMDLGIMIFDRGQWSKGYATEAIIGITNHLLGGRGFHRICADYYASNTASARIFSKAGYKIEGVFKDHFLLDGEYVDSIRIARVNE